MILETILLSLYISGALILGLLLISAIWHLVHGNKSKYKTLARNIGFAACYEFTMAVIMQTMATHKISMIPLSGKTGMCLASVIIMEAVLYRRINEDKLSNPVKLIFSSLTMSLIFTFLASSN